MANLCNVLIKASEFLFALKLVPREKTHVKCASHVTFHSRIYHGITVLHNNLPVVAFIFCYFSPSKCQKQAGSQND